jgi:hypothetical protein
VGHLAGAVAGDQPGDELAQGAVRQACEQDHGLKDDSSVNLPRRSGATPVSGTWPDRTQRLNLACRPDYPEGATGGHRPMDLQRVSALRAQYRLSDQSAFRDDYSIYHVEYSRDLVFASGAVMDRLFNTMVDRTRSRLHLPKVRMLFGSKGRPQQTWSRALGQAGSGDREASVEPHDPQGPLRTLDPEGVHRRRTRPALRGDRGPPSSSAAAADWRSSHTSSRLTGMVHRFMSMLACVELGFLPDGILDQLPTPSKLGASGPAAST